MSKKVEIWTNTYVPGESDPGYYYENVRNIRIVPDDGGIQSHLLIKGVDDEGNNYEAVEFLFNINSYLVTENDSE